MSGKFVSVWIGSCLVVGAAGCSQEQARAPAQGSAGPVAAYEPAQPAPPAPILPRTSAEVVVPGTLSAEARQVSAPTGKRLPLLPQGAARESGPRLLHPTVAEPPATNHPTIQVAMQTANPRPLHDAVDYAAAAAAAVERNGPIFHDWPAPKYALVFTGDLTGYIEPCGCSGLENLKGGLSRRHSLFVRLSQQGWPLLAFDLGGQVRRVGAQQSEVKFQQTVKGLIEMGYAAVGFGADDLRMPAAALLGAATEPYDDKTATFTSANVALFAFDSGATARYRIATVAGKKVGVTAVLGESFRQAVNNNDGIVTLPAEQALSEVVPQLLAQRCDQLILLSYASPAETEALVKKFPQFGLAVTTGGADEPPGELRLIPGTRTGAIEVGKKGQHAIVLGFYDDATNPIRWQRVPLDARFSESPAMKKLLVEYQDQLRIAGRDNLGITEKIHPRFDAATPEAASFLGSESCAKCHAAAYDVWKDSGHAHATETLTRLDPPRQFDPECLSCHVTGWDPQQYVPFQTGFSDLLKSPQLAGNGCENCHGPGGGHVAAEAGSDLKLRDAMRTLMHVSRDTVERNTCVKCHDHDNSPAFKFDEYWSQIEH